MSLETWSKNGWLRPYKTSRAQIGDLFAIVERDLEDAGTDRLSVDWQFGIAYNAALKLCTILLYSEGYRPEKSLAHFRTLQSLPLIIGEERRDEADYLDTCRVKRNTAEYDEVGSISAEEASELLEYVQELRATVLTWMKAKHPDLL
jgi:hypothetical protein